MGLIPLAIYIGLIFLRPMDWLDAVKHLPLVNPVAILTIMMAFPLIMRDHALLWRRFPQVRVALWLLIAAPFSFLLIFFLTAMSNVFQVFGKIIVLYLLIIFIARDNRRLRFLVWVVLLCIAWMAVHAILQIHTGVGFGGQAPQWRASSETYQARAFGIFNDPNDLCLAFVLALPLLYAEIRGSPNPMTKAVGMVMIPLVGYGAWCTNSRGGIVGLCGMFGAYAIVRSKGFRRWFLATAGIFMVMVVAPSRFSRGMGVDISRVSAWGDCLASFKSGPRLMLFGAGYGMERDITEDYIPAHNSFVEVLAELGLFGYVPWFLLIFLTLVHIRRTVNLKQEISRPDQFYLAGFFAALSGYLTSAYFLSRAYNHVLYIMFAFALCQCIVACREQPELLARVFGPIKRDMRNGIILALVSVIGIWITVLILNKMGR